VKAITITKELCRLFEGFRATPYICPAGVPTIGYGTTHYPDGRKVTLRDAPVTREQAEVLLENEVLKCVLAVIRQCPVILTGTDGQLGAIADFVYNLGPGRLQASTLRRKINQGDWVAARKELMRWIYGGGRILPGLVRRRKAEAAFI
jgi:lysozyme